MRKVISILIAAALTATFGLVSTSGAQAAWNNINKCNSNFNGKYSSMEANDYHSAGYVWYYNYCD
jgi:hypothetical protein